MSAIKALWKNGQIVPLEPIALPEGCLLRIETEDAEEDNQKNDPGSIARWIAEFEAIPALEMSCEEETAWHAARLAQKNLEATKFSSRMDSLCSIIK